MRDTCGFVHYSRFSVSFFFSLDKNALCSAGRGVSCPSRRFFTTFLRHGTVFLPTRSSRLLEFGTRARPPGRNEKRALSRFLFATSTRPCSVLVGSRVVRLYCARAVRRALHRKTKKRFRYYRICTRGVYAHSRGVLRTSRKIHRGTRCIIRVYGCAPDARSRAHASGNTDFYDGQSSPRGREACNFRTVLACSPWCPACTAVGFSRK